MSEEVHTATIGPIRREWQGEEPDGDCAHCGGQCAPECGLHPKGCIYGGFTEATSYWLIVEGCELYHGLTIEREVK